MAAWLRYSSLQRLHYRLDLSLWSPSSLLFFYHFVPIHSLHQYLDYHCVLCMTCVMMCVLKEIKKQQIWHVIHILSKKCLTRHTCPWDLRQTESDSAAIWPATGTSTPGRVGGVGSGRGLALQRDRQPLSIHSPPEIHIKGTDYVIVAHIMQRTIHM